METATKLDNTIIINALRNKFADAILETVESYDILTITVKSDSIHEVIEFLKDDENLQFAFLTDLCGVHYPEQELQLGVVYHLHNLYENVRLRLKTFVRLENPVLKSVSDIFSAANWMERETFDFYGIIFDGHPNLKRILNVEYLDYFPLRKEYPLEDPTRKDKEDNFFGR